MNHACSGVERAQLLGRAERLVAPPPPAFAIEDVAEPVRHRVQIGRHVQPVHRDVVARVRDHGDGFRRNGADEPTQELPAPIPPASAVTRIHGSVVRSRTDGRGHDRARAPARARPRRCRQGAVDRRDRVAARGARSDLERLMSLASHLRELGHGSTVTYSRKVVRPAHDAVPGPLPLLHVRQAAGQARTAVPVPGGGRRDRRGRSAARVQGGAVHARRPPGGALPGGARLARRTRVPLDARVRPRRRDPRDRGDGPAPAPQSRRHVLRGDGAPEAGRAVDGDDARDLLGPPVAARRPALRVAGQGPRRPSPRAIGRRAPGDPVHHRHPRRDRRDPGRARRVAPRDPRAPSALPPRPGGHRPELPGQARHGDARCARSRGTRSSWPPSRRHGSCSDRGCTSRRRRTCPTPSSRPASSRPGSTTGAASRRSRPTT